MDMDLETLSLNSHTNVSKKHFLQKLSIETNAVVEFVGNVSLGTPITARSTPSAADATNPISYSPLSSARTPYTPKDSLYPTDPRLPWHFSFIDDGMMGGMSAPVSIFSYFYSCIYSYIIYLFGFSFRDASLFFLIFIS